MLIAFVIDTSSSMNQRLPNGTSLLDAAKNAVDWFIKVSFNIYSVNA